MSYRIVYIEDVEFGALTHDFSAASDNDARRKAPSEIEALKRTHGSDILIRRLEKVMKASDMTERVTQIPF